MDARELAAMIDQTLLKPTAGYDAAADWVEASRAEGFATLCVSPILVPLAAQRLAGTDTKVCSVVGFPLGYSLTETKAEEAARLVQLGAHEIDMVCNIAAAVEGEDELLSDDIAAVVEAVREAETMPTVVKVIIETGYLEAARIGEVARIAVAAGANFVKTSTGFGPRGASVEDVRIIREAVGPDVGVKAAGGVKDLAGALAMIEAGANRIGTSSGLEIVHALREGGTAPSGRTSAEQPGS